MTGDGALYRTPGQPRTPLKCFRIPADLYLQAQAEAKLRGEYLSDMVRRAFEGYVGEGQS
jgi:hypothetical protein